METCNELKSSMEWSRKLKLFYIGMIIVQRH